MALNLPDPAAVARREADRIAAEPERFLQWPVERALSDCPFVDAESLLAGLEQFHKERMQRIPSAVKYPESPPWVDHVLAVDRELQALTGMSDRQMAQYRSLGVYLTFLGYVQARPKTREKCRVLYLPETDRGQLHAKNVDDPITFWKPDPAPGRNSKPMQGLIWDGVGCGLHIDDEPEEIFPLPIPQMCSALCGDVPSAVDFLTRYRPFWGGQNIVLHDEQKRNVAIEKGSYNFIDVFGPDASGGSHCSGMVFRDAGSPHGRYAWEKRRQYLRMFAESEDGPDMVYWKASERAEQMLAELANKPRPTVDEVIALFTTPWPDGLNKDGAKFHPDQRVIEYTLITRVVLMDEGKVYLWQRDEQGNYPSEPQVLTF